ncbi:MAG: VanZ family protein [Anaerolineales bacterium]|nr:VanZ family protein [Anaerolineales bacterium]
MKRWGPAIILMAVIFIFSSLPSAELPNFNWADRIVKKGGHALGYGLLAFAYLRGLKGENSRVSSRQLMVAWLMAVLYSATDEFHQSFTPGRHPAVTDVMIDALGAGLALILAVRYYKQK